MDEEACIEIHWTSGSLDEARKISRLLVEKRLVACAQIIPWIESIFMWNNHMDTVQESKIVLKTSRIHYEKVRELIKQHSQYEVPEISWIKIEGIDETYRNWLLESVLVSHSKA